MLDVEGVSVDLGGRPIVEEVTLRVGTGRFAALMGPNGSGKTTLIRAIAGLIPPRRGEIRVGGQRVSTLGRRRLAQTIAVLRQEPRLDVDFLVEEVVMMGRSPHKRLLEPDRAEDRAIVREALEMTDCGDLARRVFTTLSGGEKQRVLLARALAQRPTLLLLDEPTNHLDVRHQLTLLGCVRRLGMTVLAAIHDPNLALRFADDAILLSRGRIHAAGPIAEVMTEARVSDVFGVHAARVETPGGLVVLALSER
jgi:iron complex transport system ATP-binding protein